MTSIPKSRFACFSIDAVRDALGEAPPVLSIGGTMVRTTMGGAGAGQRPYFACPSCGTRRLLLFIPLEGGDPACRACWRVGYGAKLGRGLSQAGLSDADERVPA